MAAALGTGPSKPVDLRCAQQAAGASDIQRGCLPSASHAPSATVTLFSASLLPICNRQTSAEPYSRVVVTLYLLRYSSLLRMPVKVVQDVCASTPVTLSAPRRFAVLPQQQRLGCRTAAGFGPVWHRLPRHPTRCSRRLAARAAETTSDIVTDQLEETQWR
jgi:hypothetical protein